MSITGEALSIPYSYLNKWRARANTLPLMHRTSEDCIDDMLPRTELKNSKDDTKNILWI